MRGGTLGQKKGPHVLVARRPGGTVGFRSTMQGKHTTNRPGSPSQSAGLSSLTGTRFFVGGTDGVRAAWARFISGYRWQCFATLTWRSAVGAEKVRRDFLTWLQAWMGECAVSRGQAQWVGSGERRRLRGWWVNRRRRGRDQAVFVLGVEPHRTGRLHAHAVLKFPSCFGSVLLREGSELWRKWHGICRLNLPRCQVDVTSYVSKYVVKPYSEVELSESFQAVALGNSLGVA